MIQSLLMLGEMKRTVQVLLAWTPVWKILTAMAGPRKVRKLAVISNPPSLLLLTLTFYIYILDLSPTGLFRASTAQRDRAKAPRAAANGHEWPRSTAVNSDVFDLVKARPQSDQITTPFYPYLKIILFQPTENHHHHLISIFQFNKSKR